MVTKMADEIGLKKKKMSLGANSSLGRPIFWEIEIQKKKNK